MSKEFHGLATWPAFGAPGAICVYSTRKDGQACDDGLGLELYLHESPDGGVEIRGAVVYNCEQVVARVGRLPAVAVDEDTA